MFRLLFLSPRISLAALALMIAALLRIAAADDSSSGDLEKRFSPTYARTEVFDAANLRMPGNGHAYATLEVGSKLRIQERNGTVIAVWLAR